MQYQWRKSCIEITMAGNVDGFADLLSAFHRALTVVLKEGCLQEADVQPYVVYGAGQVYSIHSSLALADKLREITHIDQLFPKVQTMAGNQPTINNTNYNYAPSQNTVGDHSANTQHNHQPHTEINTDQRQQMATIVGELLKGAATLPTDQLIAVTEVKKSLEASPEDNKAGNLLSRVWQGLNEVTDFTKDKAIPIVDFAIKNKESLAAAATAITVAIGT